MMTRFPLTRRTMGLCIQRIILEKASWTGTAPASSNPVVGSSCPIDPSPPPHSASPTPGQPPEPTRKT